MHCKSFFFCFEKNNVMVQKFFDLKDIASIGEIIFLQIIFFFRNQEIFSNFTNRKKYFFLNK